MKKLIVFVGFLMFAGLASAQTLQRVNPVIKSTGGVFDTPFAVERPDPSLSYNVVIEVERHSDGPDSLNWSLYNVARYLNLLSVGGVPAKSVNVVVVIHGGATYTAMNNERYNAKYKVNNPNLRLYQELQSAGVKFFVCGQSLVNRKVDPLKLVPEVKPALSMLTTVTTYQLKGYAYLKF